MLDSGSGSGLVAEKINNKKKKFKKINKFTKTIYCNFGFCEGRKIFEQVGAVTILKTEKAALNFFTESGKAKSETMDFGLKTEWPLARIK